MARRASHFTITARDAAGRRRREGGEPFVVSIRGPGSVTTSVRDCQDGTYSVGWVANVSGVYWIVISLHGEHIGGSPFSAHVTTPHADARHCRATGLGLSEAVAGERASFRVDFADVLNRPVVAESLALAIDAQGDGGRGDIASTAGLALGGLTAIDGGDEGAYHARYVINRSGVYELHVRLRTSSEPLPGSPFILTVRPGAAHAPSTELPLTDSSTPIHTSAGVSDALTVHSYDRFRNPCAIGGATVEADTVPAEGGFEGGYDSGPLGVGGTLSEAMRVLVSDLGDGSYEVRWSGERRGLYRLAVRLGGSHIGGSPALLRVFSSRPDARACSMEGEGLRSTSVGREAAIMVRVKDRFGNPVDADPKRTRLWIELRHTVGLSRVPVEEASSERGMKTCEASWADDGLHQILYMTTRAGTYDVVLWTEHEGETYQLLHAAGSLLVTPKGPSVHQSSILHEGRVQGASYKAGAKVRIALRLLDDYGNPTYDTSPVAVGLAGPDDSPTVTSLPIREVTKDDDREALPSTRQPSRGGAAAAAAASLASPHATAHSSPPRLSPRSPGASPRSAGFATTCAVSTAVQRLDMEAVSPATRANARGSPMKRTSAAPPDSAAAAVSGVVVSTQSEPSALPIGPSATHLIEYTTAATGSYTLGISISGTPVRASPITFHVTPGVASGARSKLIPPPMPALAHEPGTAIVQACDRWGNRVVKGGAIVAARTSGPGAVQCVVCDNDDGTYGVTVVASCSGEYRLIISLDGHQHSGVVPPDATPSGYMALRQQPNYMKTTSSSRRTVESHFGRMCSPRQAFVIPAEVRHIERDVGAFEACRTELIDLNDGRYELKVATPTISGDFRVAVTLGGRPIGGSPHALTVLAPVAHYAHCKVHGSGLSLATSGETAAFEVVAHDAHGKRITYGGEQYALRLNRVSDLAEEVARDHAAQRGAGGRSRKGGRGQSGGRGRGRKNADTRGEMPETEEEEAADSTSFGRVEDRRDGSYICSYVVDRSGRYSLTVQCLKSGRQLPGSPFAVLVAPGETYAQASYLKGHDLGRAVAGEPCDFVLVSRDARGNQKMFGGEGWSAALVGPYPHKEPIEVPLKDRGDGCYKGACTMVLAGEYSLSVTLRGRHARGSPLRISAAPAGVHAARCEAVGTGLRSAYRGVAASFSIVAKDVFGNRLARGVYGYRVGIRPPLSATKAPEVRVGDNGDGTCTCEWVPATTGRHVISVTLSGVPIEGSDFICQVVNRQ